MWIKHQRGLLYATGQVKSAKDMQKPFIAICNSYIDIVPGHVHLRELADVAKEAIREMGGIPFEFNTIGVDDGIAMGHIGMRYSLPSREIIADAAETVKLIFSLFLQGTSKRAIALHLNEHASRVPLRINCSRACLFLQEVMTNLCGAAG